MEVKPGYKQTEVGVIPEDWEVKPIKELAAVKGGRRLPLGRSLTDKQTAHPYVRVTDMRPGGVDLREIKYAPDDVFPGIKNYRITSSDLFISVACTLGIVEKVPPELDGANLTENADKITNIGCDQDFLLYNLLSERIQGSIESERTVGAQPKLALGRMETFKVALPPTSTEQRAIAGVLSDMDAELAGLEQRLAKTRALKQGMMQELLTGRVRLI